MLFNTSCFNRRPFDSYYTTYFFFFSMHHFCSRICTETLIYKEKKILLQWSITKLLLLFLGIMHFLELEALHMFT